MTCFQMIFPKEKLVVAWSVKLAKYSKKIIGNKVNFFHTLTSMFAQEKLQKNKKYYPNILVRITVKKLFLFLIIFLEYFASFTIF
jgi:hypothetical protein